MRKKLGLSPQRPLRRAWQRNPQVVEQWHNETYPEIRRRAQRERARIDFADEAGMRSDDHAGTTGAPIGETPGVEATGARFGVNAVSAVSPAGEMRFRLVEGNVDGSVFADFIERLAGDTAGKVFLIVDGRPAHRSAAVQRRLAEAGGQVELFCLASESPELDPDALVWSQLKRHLGRGALASRNEI